MSVCPKCGTEIEFQMVKVTSGMSFWGGFFKLLITLLIGALVGFLVNPIIGVLVFLAGIVWCFKTKTDLKSVGICPKCGYKVEAQQ